MRITHPMLLSHLMTVWRETLKAAERGDKIVPPFSCLRRVVAVTEGRDRGAVGRLCDQL